MARDGGAKQRVDAALEVKTPTEAIDYLIDQMKELRRYRARTTSLRLDDRRHSHEDPMQADVYIHLYDAARRLALRDPSYSRIFNTLAEELFMQPFVEIHCRLNKHPSSSGAPLIRLADGKRPGKPIVFEDYTHAQEMRARVKQLQRNKAGDILD